MQYLSFFLLVRNHTGKLINCHDYALLFGVCYAVHVSYFCHFITTPFAVFRQQKLLVRMSLPSFMLVSFIKTFFFALPFMNNFITQFSIYSISSILKELISVESAVGSQAMVTVCAL